MSHQTVWKGFLGRRTEILFWFPSPICPRRPGEGWEPLVETDIQLLCKLILGAIQLFSQRTNSHATFNRLKAHKIILQILTCVGVQNLKVRGIWRYTSPSVGAYVTPVGRRKRQPESKKGRQTAAISLKEIASVCRPRPAYSRFSPIEQTFDSRIPSLRAIPNSTQIRYVSFPIQFWQVDFGASVRLTPQNGLTPEPRTSCPSPCE